MNTIFVDNKPYRVKKGQNLLQACLSLGFDIPYFCWHPILHSVGACRQCAVKQFANEKDSKGRIVMSCMTPAADGTRISIDDPDARAFRAAVIDWLMQNHPHDCPVCDEGGECHLQDMTVMTGHAYRGYRFKKRTHRNQFLGPFINHEMNRCIQCYRCVRFYRDYAGGRDLDVFACHDHVYFGRYGEGALQSPFSGNLVEICPTGVFTDKTFKAHYTRKWDLQTAPSICVHCGLGCNTLPGERYGRLRRIRNRYHPEVNGYFLCDRGRFGYEFVNSERRIAHPMRRKEDGTWESAPAESILPIIAARLAEKGRQVIGIGSPRTSLEANFALQRLVGPDRFFAGVSSDEFARLKMAATILRNGPAKTPPLQKVEDADAVLILGEDISNSAPLLALTIRQLKPPEGFRRARKHNLSDWDAAGIQRVIQQERPVLFTATAYPTPMDELARKAHCDTPENLARLGHAVAVSLDASVPAAEDITETERTLAREIARALKGADRPLIVSGTVCGSQALMAAAVNVAWALRRIGKEADIVLVVPECNSMGLALLEPAGGVEDAIQCAGGEEPALTIVLENDLMRRAEGDAVSKFLDRNDMVVVLDCLHNETGERADFVLPTATFAEGEGTLVNNEGRAQRFHRVFVPQGQVRQSWQWLSEMERIAGGSKQDGWERLSALRTELGRSHPIFMPAFDSVEEKRSLPPKARFPRQSFRYSGRTAMFAHIDVHEQPPPKDAESPLAFSMEGEPGRPPAELIARYWAPRWNSVQALNKFQQEIPGPLQGNGIPGRRLIEPSAESRSPYFADIPKFQPRPQGWYRVVDRVHVFGSEELSALSPAVAQRAPAPYIALNPRDAAEIGLEEGDTAAVGMDRRTLHLPVKVVGGMPVKTVAIPLALTDWFGPLPATATVARRPTDE